MTKARFVTHMFDLLDLSPIITFYCSLRANIIARFFLFADVFVTGLKLYSHTYEEGPKDCPFFSYVEETSIHNRKEQEFRWFVLLI